MQYHHTQACSKAEQDKNMIQYKTEYVSYSFLSFNLGAVQNIPDTIEVSLNFKWMIMSCL